MSIPSHLIYDETQARSYRAEAGIILGKAPRETLVNSSCGVWAAEPAQIHLFESADAAYSAGSVLTRTAGRI